MEAKRPEKFLRVDQVAELLALSKSYIYYLVNSGELELVSFGKGSKRPRASRIPESSIERYISRMRDGG